MTNNVWIACVNVSPKNSSTILEDAFGAYVYVLKQSTTLNEFLAALADYCDERDLNIIRIDDIEKMVSVDQAKERTELIVELYKAALLDEGIKTTDYHTYSRDHDDA